MNDAPHIIHSAALAHKRITNTLERCSNVDYTHTTTHTCYDIDCAYIVVLRALAVPTRPKVTSRLTRSADSGRTGDKCMTGAARRHNGRPAFDAHASRRPDLLPCG